MPYHRTLVLTPDQQQELERLRAAAPKPMLRERAAALLKIAAGHTACEVARTGLLRPRQPDTVYRWLDRYLQQGVAGLADRPGRGRKPAFSPPTARYCHGAGTRYRPARSTPTRPGGRAVDLGRD